MNKICGQCEYTDGLIYTSLPAQVKCTITNKFRFQNDYCNIKFKPIKYGEWVPVHMSEDGGQSIYFLHDCGCEVKDKTNFCPNCGADMRQNGG